VHSTGSETAAAKGLPVPMGDSIDRKAQREPTRCIRASKLSCCLEKSSYLP
jgi:hypothetical protein